MADQFHYLVDAVAEILGQPLVANDGIRRYGKHSWRATGAVYLTSLRMELHRIQLLARWSSPVIMHYARLAPLANVAEHVRELQVADNMSDMVKKIEGRRGEHGKSSQHHGRDHKEAS